MHYLVKFIFCSYLGRTVDRFSDGVTPGDDWVASFSRRHANELFARNAANISRSRAAVSRPVLQEYFSELEKTIEGVPPSHIYNYDETNVTDDPGSKKFLYRRGA